MNKAKSKIRVAVASDLHFVDATKFSELNHYNLALTDASGTEPRLWQRLCEKVRVDKISADLLITPGDVTTFADETGLKYAWSKLQELGELLKVGVVAAATGNHDVQSRPLQVENIIRDLNLATDLTENLRLLSPPYPISILSQNPCLADAHNRRIKYFGSDFVIFDDHKDFRLIVFNSCGRHTTEKKEFERGRVAKSSLAWLEQELNELYNPRDKKIGIFVCHHHPIVHEDHNLGSYDQMQNGTELVSLLSRYGDWIVIHGHKHHAKITYAPGGAKKLPVFAAGTLSAQGGVGDNGLSNQFYILTLELEKHGLVGYVETWKWSGSDWARTKSKNDGVFTGAGFGLSSSLYELAEKIDEKLTLQESRGWEALKKELPELGFLLPSDYCHLEQDLDGFGVKMYWSDHGELESVVKEVAL